MIKLLIILLFQIIFLNCQVPLSNFYPYGTHNGDTALPDGDDEYSLSITIPNKFPFFQRNFSNLLVNINGLIVFNQLSEDTFTPQLFPTLGMTGVAPFWADIDTRSGGGKIFYRSTTNYVQLGAIAEDITRGHPDFFNLVLNWAVIATWVDVCQFEMRCQHNNTLRNTFQAVLTTNGRHSFAIFKYNKINWGEPQVGFNEGNGVNFFSVPGSFSPLIANTLLTESNVNISPGLWIFRIDSSDISEGGCNPDAPAIAHPPAGVYIGNYNVKITGPCFSRASQVVIRFSSGLESICRVVSNFEASCPVPMMRRAGKMDYEVIINNRSSHYGFFQSVIENNAMVTEIKVDKDIYVNAMDTVTISWSLRNVTSNSNLRLMTVGVSLNSGLETNWNRFVSSLNPITLTITLEMRNVLENPSFSQNFFFFLLDNEGYLVASSKILFYFGNNDAQSTCQEWHRSEGDISKMRNQLASAFPCPRFLTIPAGGGVTNVQIPNFVVDQTCIGVDACPFNPGAAICYRSITATTDGHGQQCCYSKLGTLLLDAPSGGSIDKHHASSLDSYWNHMIHDILPYYKCCKLTSNCNLYYEKRPSDRGDFWIPPTVTGGSGDPHFKTLDGFGYTFNGHGEYELLAIDSIGLEVQVRLSPVRNSSMANKATVISAVVCKEKNSAPIQIELMENGEISVIYNKSALSFDLLNYWDMNEFIISKDNLTYSIKFLSGVALEVQTNADRNQLSVLLYLPEEYKGKTKGLSGYWDGDSTNDLLLPNGTFLKDLSEANIHYEFGQKWEVTQNTSLFFYSTGTSYNGNRNPNFRPLFISENLVFANPQLELAAQDRCQGSKECLFDIAVSGDLSFADLQLQIAETVDELKEVYEVEIVITQQNINESFWITTNDPEITNDLTTINTTFIMTTTHSSEKTKFQLSKFIVLMLTASNFFFLFLFQK